MEYVRARTIVITGLVLVLVAALAVVTLREVLRPGPGCTTALGDGARTVTVEQADNAATIAGVGLAMDMPDHAVTVALATAMQESGLRNLPDGDRDSAGLFQQRPSQGWGTPAKLQDPRYSAGKFYTALNKVKGWKTMRVTDAAQKVQRSAYPNAYQKWADEAEALAAGLRLDWGKSLAAGSAVAAAAGLTVDVADSRAGWRYAHWLVSHASENGVERVRFADLEWHAPTGEWERAADGKAAGGSRVVAEVFG
jgi:hypothetical protein